jgi:hypothetical protein
MRFLAGDARISFEGDLSNCDFPASIPRIAEESYSSAAMTTFIPNALFASRCADKVLGRVAAEGRPRVMDHTA